MALSRQHDDKKNDVETDFETKHGRCLKCFLSNALRKISSFSKTCAEVGLKLTKVDFFTLSLCAQPCHICGISAFE